MKTRWTPGDMVTAKGRQGLLAPQQLEIVPQGSELTPGSQTLRVQDCEKLISSCFKPLDLRCFRRGH